MRESGHLSADLPDEAATRAAGAALARALVAVGVDRIFVTLQGELGAGKTTLVRGFLAGLGVGGPVRSPTFTLVESYPAGARVVDHLDWYRLADSGELDGLGFRDLLAPGHWVLVEWPERAPEAAAGADLALTLSYAPAGRRMGVEAITSHGGRVIRRLMADKTLG
jgi:tRNA threonylcarbamoyladenosine biosynthesis protein TsaE